MKIRVIPIEALENYCDALDIEMPAVTNVSNDLFMAVYEGEGEDWEFDSIKAFANEFNSDGPYAPMPSTHIIKFFENE